MTTGLRSGANCSYTARIALARGDALDPRHQDMVLSASNVGLQSRDGCGRQGHVRVFEVHHRLEVNLREVPLRLVAERKA